MDAFPEVEASAERVNEHLAAVRRGLVGVGQLEVKFGFSLGESGHALHLHNGDVVSTDFSHIRAFFFRRLRIGDNWLGMNVF